MYVAIWLLVLCYWFLAATFGGTKYTSYSYITTTSVISVLLHKAEGTARGRV